MARTAKTGSKTATAKKAKQTEVADQVEEQIAEDNLEENEVDEAPEDAEFGVRISYALERRLASQAEEEGLSLEEYVAELLAEAAVVRAWEIAEKKVVQRGNQQPSGNGNHRGGNSGNGGNHRRGRKSGNRRGNMNSNSYNSLMDDKASFLEYVRNQERKQKR